MTTFGAGAGVVVRVVELVESLVMPKGVRRRWGESSVGFGVGIDEKGERVEELRGIESVWDWNGILCLQLRHVGVSRWLRV